MSADDLTAGAQAIGLMLTALYADYGLLSGCRTTRNVGITFHLLHSRNIYFAYPAKIFVARLNYRLAKARPQSVTYEVR